ncbi:MAG TPA: aldehyde dehydrogenase family protein [Actinomycetota bacterium]|nr:aldehyde dehydrogenase family protein [Actinomycetota bacterium]
MSLTNMPTVSTKPALDLPGMFDAAVVKSEGGPPTLQLSIGGEWREARSGETFDINSPIDGSVIARAQKADGDDVEAAIEAAAKARADFRKIPASDRLEICKTAAELMHELLDDFIEAVVLDLGKTRTQAKSEVSSTAERLELVREEVRKIFGEYLPGDWIGDTQGKAGIVLREPVGTVAAIGPFNYPLFLSASKIIPAIAAGNTVVAKAPSDDPIALIMFARVMEEAGLPAGVLNVVTGRGSEVGDIFASHDEISMISFTGSTGVGRSIASLAGPKPLHLELGGNAAGIVLADSDLENAVSKTVLGAFKNAGQRCDALSRILVEESIYDDYVERATEAAEGYKVGDPRADGVDVGPLVNQKAAERVNALVTDATDKGAKLLLGGEAKDCYHEPTVLADVSLGAEIAWEETFGPVLPIIRVRDLDHALEIANRSRYGLDSSVFTTNLDKAWKAARALEVGMVHINDAPAHGVGHFPFGGFKPDSGIGREGLGYSIDEVTILKTVVMPS